ncbi:hypothetical protein ABTM57_19600, partial [Acinetobacter baumannii]
PIDLCTDLKLDQSSAFFSAARVTSGEGKIEGELILPHYDIDGSSGKVHFSGGRAGTEWSLKGTEGELTWTEGLKGHLKAEVSEAEVGVVKVL